MDSSDGANNTNNSSSVGGTSNLSTRKSFPRCEEQQCNNAGTIGIRINDSTQRLCVNHSRMKHKNENLNDRKDIIYICFGYSGTSVDPEKGWPIFFPKTITVKLTPKVVDPYWIHLQQFYPTHEAMVVPASNTMFNQWENLIDSLKITVTGKLAVHATKRYSFQWICIQASYPV